MGYRGVFKTDYTICFVTDLVIRIPNNKFINKCDSI